MIYNRAIWLNPENEQTYTSRAIVWELMGDTEEALADYNLAIKLCPTEPTSYFARAITREKMGDISGALKDFAKVSELDANLGICD